MFVLQDETSNLQRYLCGFVRPSHPRFLAPYRTSALPFAHRTVDFLYVS